MTKKKIKLGSLNVPSSFTSYQKVGINYDIKQVEKDLDDRRIDIRAIQKLDAKIDEQTNKAIKIITKHISNIYYNAVGDVNVLMKRQSELQYKIRSVESKYQKLKKEAEEYELINQNPKAHFFKTRPSRRRQSV